jgi:hypothetical protein
MHGHGEVLHLAGREVHLGATSQNEGSSVTHGTMVMSRKEPAGFPWNTQVILNDLAFRWLAPSRSQVTIMQVSLAMPDCEGLAQSNGWGER